MNYPKYFILLFSLFFSFAQGQNLFLEKKEKLNTRIEIGIDRGVQLSKNFPILKSGEQVNLSLSKLYGSHFEAGIGVAYQNLEDEQFMPIYLLLVGKRKVEAGPYIESAIGYSYGKNSKYEHAATSSFEGGKYFSTGIGYEFNINNQYAFLASCNYIMQHSQVTHQQQERVDYIEELTFDMIVFKVGLLLK